MCRSPSQNFKADRLHLNRLSLNIIPFKSPQSKIRIGDGKKETFYDHQRIIDRWSDLYHPRRSQVHQKIKPQQHRSRKD